MEVSVDPIEGIAWSRPKSLPGVELLSATNNAHAWTVFHERYAIFELSRLDGTVLGRYRGKPLSFSEQDISLMEPGETHTTTSFRGDADFNVLFMDPEMFLGEAEERGLPGQVHFRLAQLRDERLNHAIQGLITSLKAGGSPMEQQSWLAHCIQGMLGHAERKPREPSGHSCRAAVKQVMDYLRERYQEPVDLEELSALTGLSRFYLVHAFSTQVGIPPHAYQTRIRIERARILLGLGVPLAMVAANVGFADQSHFSRHFKSIMQITPGQYARFSRRTRTFPSGVT